MKNNNKRYIIKPNKECGSMRHSMTIKPYKSIREKRKTKVVRGAIIGTSLMLMACGIKISNKNQETENLFQTFTSVDVKEGDTLEHIAQKYITKYKNEDIFGSSTKFMNVICELNGIINANDIEAGSTLTIPVYVTEKEAEKMACKDEKDEACTVTYSVRAGDNLSDIADAFGTTVEYLEIRNGIKGNFIQPGDRYDIYTTVGTALENGYTEEQVNRIGKSK